jgi:glyoxylase-like metal-dependent hydrolase (beta-lactamase superfamily II)
MVQLGRFRLDLISDGFFEDDADAFVQPCTERDASPRVRARVKRRIKVGFNSLLIRGGGSTVIVDPGTGDKPRPDKVAQYRMEWPRRTLPALKQLNVPVESVDAVILTHLHWDHAGAATRLTEGRDAVPAFPRAQYYVQELELEAAREAVRRGDASYCPNDFEPLIESGCLQTVTGQREILPGITVRWTGGHCRGLQIVYMESDGRRAVFLSDLIPAAAQLPLDCFLSYDEDVPQLRAAKEAVLSEARQRGDLLLFVHAPRNRAGYLKSRADGSSVFESIRV